MTSFELLKLLGNAQDSYIMDSRKRPRKAAKPPVLRIAALAACAALVIAAGGTVLYLKPWASSAPTGHRSFRRNIRRQHGRRPAYRSPILCRYAG